MNGGEEGTEAKGQRNTATMCNHPHIPLAKILQSIEARIREAGRAKPQTIDGEAVMVADLALPALREVKVRSA